MKQPGEKKVYRIVKLLFILCCVCAVVLTKDNKVFAQEDPIQEAKNAVVEVYSGFTTDDGSFHKLKHASGFVISNDGQAYIITTQDTLKNSEKSKTNYCKKHDISTEGHSLRDSIQVVVKGDVTVEASVLTESEEDNYSILQVASSISERTALKLGNTENLITGDTVYALGFADNAGTKENPTEFLAANVEISEGKMQDTGANKNNVIFLQHSAVVSDGNTGGPLVNSEGYVIGMNNAALNDEAPVVFYSLPIGEIRAILDNFQIPYDNVENDVATKEFLTLLEECQTLAQDEKYKSSSKAALQKLIQCIGNMDEAELMSEEKMTALSSQLLMAKDELQLKMKTTRKVIYVLLGVIAFMAVWLLRLLLWKKNTKMEQEFKKIEPQKKEGKKKQSKDTVIEKPVKEEPVVSKENISDAAKRLNQYMADKEQEWIPGMALEDEEEKTMILDASVLQEKETKNQSDFRKRKYRAILKRLRTGELIVIDKMEVSLGKSSDNDVVIADNRAISKRHAFIVWEDEQYYIVDRGSANGTFINGMEVLKEERTELANGDAILLADEKFLFKMEE